MLLDILAIDSAAGLPHAVSKLVEVVRPDLAAKPNSFPKESALREAPAPRAAGYPPGQGDLLHVAAGGSTQPLVVAPRLQMELDGRANPNGTAFFIGTIYNASDSPAERVQYALAGYVDISGGVPPRPERAGSLVRGQTPKPVILRFDNLSMQTQPIGMEHVLVEFADASGRRYEQRGRLIAHCDVTGKYSFTFDGLAAPKPIEAFRLAPLGLEDP